MTRDKFEKIYNNCIVNLKNDLDPEQITRFKIFSSQRIFLSYQLEKHRIKKYYMRNSQENIDRHKIASSMLYSIMKISPAYIPITKKIKKFFKGEKFSREISYINEYIAIYTALSILDNFYLQDEKDGVLDSRRHRIYIPETFSDDYGYIFNTCIDLKFGKVKKKINTLTYSNIFFLLEYQHPFNKEH